MEKRDNNSSSDLEHKLEIVENKLVFIKEQYESAIRFFKITLTSISGFFGVISILVVVLSLFLKVRSLMLYAKWKENLISSLNKL